jgi:hypothetical protein
MKLDSLPRAVLQSLVQLDDEAKGWATEHDALAEKVERLRAIINGRIEGVTREAYALAQKEFDGVHREMVAAKARAQAAASTAASVKVWIDALDQRTRMTVVQLKAAGLSLDKTRKRIAAINSERRAIANAITPSADIAQRVHKAVAQLGSRALPTISGIASGEVILAPPPELEYQLGPLATVAWLDPERLEQALLAHIAALASKPLPVAQRAGRIKFLGEKSISEEIGNFVLTPL